MTGYATTRTAQALAPAPKAHALSTWEHPSGFSSGVERLASDAPCEAEEAPRRAEGWLIALRSRGGDARAVAGGRAFQIGSERGLPVVYVPCRGTYVLAPSRMDALRAGSSVGEVLP